MVRGEVYLAELSSRNNEHVQGGYRPVIVISNNKGNEYSDNVVVVPMTTKKMKNHQITHARIIFNHICQIVLCENPTTISKAQIHRRVGKVSDKSMSIVNEAHKRALF